MADAKEMLRIWLGSWDLGEEGLYAPHISLDQKARPTDELIAILGMNG